MSILQPFILGFLVAFIGIIPPGMLNMTVAKLSIDEGKNKAMLFGYGALIIVILQCFIGLYFATFLEKNPVVNNYLKQFALVVFIILTVFFIYKGFNARKPNKEVKIEKKKNRFIHGILLSAVNMFAIPYYVVSSLTLSGKNIYHFTTLENTCFLVGDALATYLVFYIYAVLFRKLEHKLGFLVQNINFIIAGITGTVVISTIYKMYFT